MISSEDLDADGAAPSPPTPSEPVTVEIKPKQAKPAAKAAPAQPTSQMPTVPPAAPAAATPWHRRNRGKLLFGGGLVAALSVGFLVSFVLLGVFDSARDRTHEALTDATAAVGNATTGIRKAAADSLPFTALQGAATTSEARADTVSASLDDLTAKVDDPALVGPTTAALNAEHRLLVQLGSIADFPLDRLPRSWNRLRPKLTRSQARIDASRGAVLALDLGNPATVMPPSAQIDAAIDAAGSIIKVAAQKISAWRARRAAAQAAVADAEAYRAAMEPLIAEYYEQRDETRGLVRAPRVPWNTAAETLEAHAAARQGIIDRMNGLPVPIGVESAHAEMTGLAAESRQLLVEAAEVTRTDPFIIWTGSPGYHQFSTASDQITVRFDPARSAVLGAADQAISSARAELAQVGPRPQV